MDTETAAKPERILVCDDDPEVVPAADGAAALRIIESEEAVDHLFTDVVMPGLNGFEVARLARQRRPGLEVLFASGYATDFTPAGRLLKKPYRPSHLAQEVEQLLAG